MDQASVESNLVDLALPAIRFFQTIGSTNDEAWRWFEAGAPHGAIVLAEEQSAGHGRMHRRWMTAAGSGLAFSLILHAPPIVSQSLSRLTGLGAVAVCQALNQHYSLPAQIKWPNDILLGQRKAGGVLAELRWKGQELMGVVIGVGLNITHRSVEPDILPLEILEFPATCLEDELGVPINRLDLLHDILQEFFAWEPKLVSQEFKQVWEINLAYRDRWVEIVSSRDSPSSDQSSIAGQSILGKVIGLTEDGSLQLRSNTGELVVTQVGTIHLRPVAPPG